MVSYCVYKHTAPNEKIYIGITSQEPKKRFNNGNGYNHNEHFKRAISLYGWENIKHEIIKDGLTRSEAIDEERRLIAFFDSTDFNKGYNLMTGGDGIGTHTQKTREKLRLLSLGKKWTTEQREKQRQKMTGHVLSDKSKNQLREKRLGDKNPFYGKKHSDESIKKIREHAADFNGDKSVNARAVVQFDYLGNKIAEYGAISTAAKSNDIQNAYNISACCRGRQKTAYGFIWKYVEEAEC